MLLKDWSKMILSLIDEGQVLYLPISILSKLSFPILSKNLLSSNNSNWKPHKKYVLARLEGDGHQKTTKASQEEARVKETARLKNY